MDEEEDEGGGGRSRGLKPLLGFPRSCKVKVRKVRYRSPPACPAYRVQSTEYRIQDTG